MADEKQETPGYSSADDVAKLLEISVQQVNQLRKEGILKQYRTPAGNRFKLIDAVKDYIHFIRSDKNDARRTFDEARKLKAEATLKEYKAREAKLQLLEIEGKVHKSEDIEAIMTELVFSVRSMIMALPGRLAVDLANAKTAQEASDRIEAECYEILDETQNFYYDPEKYKERVREREGWNVVSDPDDENDE